MDTPVHCPDDLYDMLGDLAAFDARHPDALASGPTEYPPPPGWPTDLPVYGGSNVVVQGDPPKPTVSNDAGLREMHDWGMWMMLQGGQLGLEKFGKYKPKNYRAMFKTVFNYPDTWFMTKTKGIGIPNGLGILDIYNGSKEINAELFGKGESTGARMQSTLSGVITISTAETGVSLTSGIGAAQAIPVVGQVFAAAAGGVAFGSFARENLIPDWANEKYGDAMLSVIEQFGYKP